MTTAANPVLVELWRGGLVESLHRGAVAIVDCEGAEIAALGDVARPIYPRSAVKALQAVALVESGAAEALGLSDRELAVACASHSGEPAHLAAVRSLLAKAGWGEDALQCGAHWPLSEEAARALVLSGGRPRAIHNNCSGKHAGMLALARAMGVPPEGYVAPAHPVQRQIRAVIEDLTGEALDEDRCAVDGCSVPTWGLPLRALARAFARFASGRDMTSERARACTRLRRACAAHPEMVAGAGRFCTIVIAALGEAAFVKGGAEGVYCAALPGAGLGMALKIDDGARRASEAAAAAVLAALLPGRSAVLTPYTGATVHNWRGLAVGAISISAALRSGLEVASLRMQGGEA